jgi:hypothetical protein
MVLSADKSNATVILSTEDYTHKIATLLGDPAYRRLDKDRTESVEGKTSVLIKKSSLLEEVTGLLRPCGWRPPRLYGVPLRPIVSTIFSPTYGLEKHLAGLLGSQLGQLQHHVKNSKEFVHTLDTLCISPEDILLSFNIISLFTRAPLKDALNLLIRRFNEDMILFHHVLTSSIFCFNGQFHEQISGVAMGLPLSPVIANFYMEAFEEEALKRAAYKPPCCFKYADDTFVNWPHRCEKLDNFLSTSTTSTPTYSSPWRLREMATSLSWL